VHPRRFVPAVLIGGGAAGVLLAVPFVGDVLRCALCLGVLAGAALSMKLWLDTHLAENLTSMEAATLGALSGAVSAAVAWVVSVPVRIAAGQWLGDFYMDREMLPTSLKYLMRALYTSDFGDLLVTLFFQGLVYAAMGALGGFLTLQYLFVNRRAEAPPG
jgi:hypothetical protein